MGKNIYLDTPIYLQLLYKYHKGVLAPPPPSPRDYKTFFMLNSSEHEICHANHSQITNNYKFLLNIAEHENFSANNTAY